MNPETSDVSAFALSIDGIFANCPDCYPVRLGKACETEVEAWAAHNDELASFLRWVRGYKYWRRQPKLYTDKCMETGEVTYLVASRAFAVESPLDGIAEIEKP